MIDALKLVANGASLTGVCELSALERLDVDATRIDGQLVRVALSFGRGLDGVRIVEAEIEAELPRICQRCLKAMEEPVRSRAVWALAEDETEEASLDARYEAVLRVDQPLSLWEAVEDELLLAAALAPRHGPDEACDYAPRSEGSDDAVQNRGGRPHPMASLAGWKRNSD